MERNWRLLLLMIVVSVLHAAPVKNKNVPRCGVEDSKKGNFSLANGYRWRKQHITWAFHGPAPSHIGHQQTIKIISEAFQRWADIVPLKFSNVCPTCNADIPVYFSSDDGPFGVFARVKPTGPRPYFDGSHPIMVFDKDENWSTEVEGNADDQISLFVVAAHEIGHLLGLFHDESSDALMHWTHLEGRFKKEDIVPPRDKKEIRKIYGSKNISTRRTTTTTTTTITTTTTTTTTATTTTTTTPLYGGGDDEKTFYPYNNAIIVLRNKATSKILDSNWDGHVYTNDLYNNDHQKWMLIQQDDGTYMLKNIATSRVLDSDGKEIHTLGANGRNYQKWRFHRQHDGSYVLENLATSHVLNSDSKAAAGQLHSDGDDSQKWFFSETGINPRNNMIAVLTNKLTKKILDSNRDGHVYTNDLYNNDHQKWMVVQQDDGTYILENIATSRVLDSDGKEIYTLGANGGNYQKWRFHRQHDGSYVLENLATSHVLNSDSKAAAGQLHSNGDDSQKWFFAETGINTRNNMIAVLTNKLTNKILDSNWDGHVYTNDLYNSDHQKWMAVQQDDGTYILKNIATSRVLDSNGNEMYTLGANGGNYQKWRFHRQHDGSYVLENLATSHVLNSDSKAAAGQLHSNDDDSQKWFFAETGIDPRNNMIAVLTNNLTKKILDSNWDGHVYTNDLYNNDYQKWMVVQQDDGTYMLKNIATSRVLDSNGNEMYTLGANGGNYQKWRFHRQHDGSYVLENLATSHVLNSDSKAAAGQLHSNDDDSQKWFFTARWV